MLRAVRPLVIALFVACSSTTPPDSPASPSAPPAKPQPEIAVVPEPPPDDLAIPNRPLTSGEIALLKPIFRDGIDYAKVRVINNSFPLQPENVYMTPRGHVYAPGRLFRDDFSTAAPYIRGVFVHELTHVWQHANGMDLVGQSMVEFTKYRGAYEKAYPYELAPNRDLVEYGMEQQASIVEDYYLVTVVNDEPHRMTNRNVSRKDRDALFASVLKNFLGNATYAKGLDPQKIADQHAKSSEEKTPGPEACKESESEHGAEHMCAWRYEPRKKP
jgi:hypothetical protein